jgi:hypothetical protein
MTADSALARLRVDDGHNDLPIALRFRRESLVDAVGTGLAELHTDILRLRAARSAPSSGRCWSGRRSPGWPWTGISAHR